MGELFISYAREDQDFVRRLASALESRGKQAWVDWEGIEPADRWAQSVAEAINAADAVVFVLSERSLASGPCLEEIEHASAGHKRLIPIIVEDIAEDAVVPDALPELNWIFLRPRDDFEDGVDKLIRAVELDLDLVRLHSRVLTRAEAWDLAGRRQTPLLRGGELEEAERWLARAAAGAEPQPTELQASFIAASRKYATRRQRVALGASLAVAAIAAVLALFAFVQRNRANHEATIALSRFVGSEALSDLNNVSVGAQAHLVRGTLLALEAYRAAPTEVADSSVLTSLIWLNRYRGLLRDVSRSARSRSAPTGGGSPWGTTTGSFTSGTSGPTGKSGHCGRGRSRARTKTRPSSRSAAPARCSPRDRSPSGRCTCGDSPNGGRAPSGSPPPA